MDSISLIKDFLGDRLGVAPESVVPDAVLAELGVDSLMMLELIFEFEDKFELKLANDIKSPKTVGEMANLMNRLVQIQKA